GFAGWWMFGRFRAPRTDLLYHTVRAEKLQLSIVERGASLESAENRDVVCRVKAKTQGGTIATTIKSVIDNGTRVKTGQLLVELDDSGLQDSLQTERSNYDTAKSNYIQAAQTYKIQESQNESDLATARVNLDLALLALEQYKDGDYLQTKRGIEGRRMMARSDLEMWEERSAWSERMSRPGRRYVTAAQADSDRARLASANIALQTVDEEMRVLEEYTARINLKKLQSAIDETRRALDRVEKQAVANLAKVETDRNAKYSLYVQESIKVKD